MGFSPNGQQVVSGSWQGIVRLWNAETGTELSTIPVLHSGSVNHLAFSADGQMVMYICNNTTIRLWDTGFRV